MKAILVLRRRGQVEVSSNKVLGPNSVSVGWWSPYNMGTQEICSSAVVWGTGNGERGFLEVLEGS